ncbi:16S rRNA (uracil(1498)-N(3))-methyltransferase [Psychromonas antarctica]|jgi:16S rRNA (uracil1498-N3)-methyltransferase|uniref:16S rRNA (uracil(1498)-N(3))-methyltransferase n=1 Tax=Psychromonas antarctica TaxID=67573 RepID=UPI001EE80327|nr:16S rRNA (uracil(1498)-N(3))-methyltransferase [Psychromonas antarctica]MCG6202878.1 16S rRNA (uracil(1498)-N(3))-methyltransferase [Psychromonas antarctica]
MSNPRFYDPQQLLVSSEILLGDDATQHIRVLRLKVGAEIILFNGSGGQYLAILSEVQKRSCMALIKGFQETDNESPLHLHLGQVISRGDRMEFVIQKAVELGVNEITPLMSERCGVKINAERMLKKQQQWHKIAIAACEQSGRNIIPTIHPTQSLQAWCECQESAIKLTLHPRANYSINTLANDINKVRLLIGPEGGLSDDEIALTKTLNFTETLLGPRILRTETAALTAITALQCRFGDLA